MTEESFWSTVICTNCSWEGKENELDGLGPWGCPACGELEIRYEDGLMVDMPEEEA